VLNAANEVVVDRFLSDGLAFDEIPQVIRAVLDAHTPAEASSLAAVLKADTWAREEAQAFARHATSAAQMKGAPARRFGVGLD
jgi:1-deoxy-D-xylulose-5-phosphate reductoisomerase